MKFFVFGCNGMAGHLVSVYLQEQGHEVVGFARSKSSLVKTIVGDALDPKVIKSAVETDSFDAIVNCIGLLNQFAENNKAQAVYLNSFFPHYLAQLTKDTATQIIHISTDCVFSGKRGQYSEDDLRDGTTFYDRSKALGELEDDKNLTLRQSIIGPDIKASGIGLLNWFMQQKGPLNGFTGALWTGLTTLQLAKVIEEAAQVKAHGLHNIVPDHYISKYDLLGLFNKYMRKGSVSIAPVDRMTANKSLKRTKFDFAKQIPDYEQMIAELADWMRAHKNLYPHYEL